MDWGFIIGHNWGQRVIIIGAVIIYVYMSIFRPEDAKASAFRGLRTFAGLLTLIFAALLIASAIQVLIPPEAVQQYLGGKAGFQGVLLGGLLGGLIQGGPYAAYPIIKGLKDEGASIAVVVALLIGYGVIGSGRIAFGLAFFEPKVIATRVVMGVLLTIIAAIILYAWVR